MAKETLANQLKKKTEEAQRERKRLDDLEKKQAKRRVEEAGKRMAKSIIENLPTKMEEAAAEGYSKIILVHLSGRYLNEANDAALPILTEWVKEQGFHTHFIEGDYFDPDYPVDPYVEVCWADHSKDKSTRMGW